MNISKKTSYILSFIIPTIVFANYVLNHIYVYGSGVYDVGWFIHLFSNEIVWPLKNPENIGVGETFFSTHFSLFFYITSFFYKIIEELISPHLYFSIFIGSMYGIISLSIFIAINKIINIDNFYKIIAALSIAILTSFNGAGLALIGFPHIEIAIPALIILFITLYFTNYKYLAYITFIFLLTIREDAGFHLFGLLFLIILTTSIYRKKFEIINLDLLFIMIFSFIFSIFAIYIQKTYFPGDNALERVYLGNPHFAHLTFEYFIKRIGFLFLHREYLYIPILSSIILAYLYKNNFLIVAFISIIPWSILLLIAITPMPHTFSNYYTFPFILVLSWPILSFLILKYITKKEIEYKKIILSFLLVSFSSTIFYDANSNVEANFFKKIHFEYISHYESIENFKNTVNKDNLGNILYDESAACLFVKKLNTNEYSYLNNFSDNQIQKVNTLIFNNQKGLNGSSLVRMKEIILKSQLKNIYQLENSNIIIATQKVLNFNYLINISYNNFINKIFEVNAANLPSNIGQIENEYRKAKKGSSKIGYLTYGPYINLHEGNYSFDITYESSDNESIIVGAWDVGIHTNNQFIQLNKGNINGSKNQEKHITNIFYISKEHSNNKIEIRNFYNGIGDLIIKSLTITRVE